MENESQTRHSADGTISAVLSKKGFSYVALRSPTANLRTQFSVLLLSFVFCQPGLSPFARLSLSSLSSHSVPFSASRSPLSYPPPCASPSNGPVRI